MIQLDFLDICVSSGSACASGFLAFSHVLRTMGVSQEQGRSAVRFSLSKWTTQEEIDYVLERLSSIASRLRKYSPFWSEGENRDS